MRANDEDATSTLVGPRNFSLNREERLRALIAGPPAFAVRRRRIEELEGSIARAIAETEAKTGAPLDPGAPPPPIARSLAALRRLVEAHNAYYPIEASLPVDVVTGEFLELGKRWAPLAMPTLEDLSVRSRGGGR